MSIKSKFMLLLLFWAFSFIPIYPALVSAWLYDSNNSHGMLVPVISAFLVWQERKVFRGSNISNSNWGVLILLSSVILYIVSYVGGVTVVARMMIVFSLIGLVLFNLGKSIFPFIKFPLFFLLFMVPVPDSIYSALAFPLQLLVSKLSTVIIQALTIPVYREGNMIWFAQTQLEVAEACSGLRSMMALIMLGTLFAHFTEKSRLREKLIILVSTVPLSLFLNLLRVTVTGIIGHFWGEKVARGFLHNFSGLVIFAFGVLLFFAECYLLQKLRTK